jgi:hypothetical protein
MWVQGTVAFANISAPSLRPTAPGQPRLANGVREARVTRTSLELGEVPRLANTSSFTALPGDDVQILCVVHGRRDLAALFKR